jgi:hypothetical protein
MFKEVALAEDRLPELFALGIPVLVLFVTGGPSCSGWTSSSLPSVILCRSFLDRGLLVVKDVGRLLVLPFAGVEEVIEGTE